MATHRPLSPHLQIYKPQITSILSIMHRMTGIALILGAVYIIGFLVSLSSGEQCFALYAETLKIPYMYLFHYGFIFSLAYHFLNGIRHLFWDFGVGFEMKMATLSGWLVVILSIILTIYIGTFL
jgi:succinate dehydrogenase / fumarate reductase cytochrome b subunit